MIRVSRALRWACVVSLAACIASVGGPQVWGVDLEQAKTAIVALEAGAAGPIPSGYGRGLRLQPPLPTRQIVTGFRVDVDGEPLIVSLLDRTTRESDSLRLAAGTGEPQPARVIAWDAASGLAVLRVADENENPDPDTTGDVAALPLSDMPASWGAPVRVLSQWKPGSPAISAGVVSTETSFDRTLGAEIFQTDAIVRASSRGGPILNDAGEVVGIITAMHGTGDVERTGTAVGVEAIARLVTFVRDGGTGPLPKPRLGVALETSPAGVIVRSIIDESPARQAGVEPGDRIVAIDQQNVREYEEVIAAVTAKQPGDTLEVTVERDGQTEQLTVTLDEIPPQEADAAGPPPVTLYDPPTIVLPGGQPITPETLRQWLEQQGMARPELPTVPTTRVPHPPSVEQQDFAQPPRSDAASPMLPARSDELSEKLDELSEQLRQLSEQVQEMRESEPEATGNRRD